MKLEYYAETFKLVIYSWRQPGTNAQVLDKQFDKLIRHVHLPIKPRG
jgi:hypothetical protein